MPGIFDYRVGLEIAGHDYPFYALIQAAMRKADTTNMAKLFHMWPDEAVELQHRYNAPGGWLPGEQSESER